MLLPKKINGLMLGVVMIMCVPSSYAIDQSKQLFQITIDAFRRSLNFTSDTTTSTRDKFKLVQAAKSDAATYVASNGIIQGPYLTNAFVIIRNQYPVAKTVKDIDLAKAILSL